MSIKPRLVDLTAPTLATERLVLRAQTTDDFEPYAAMWADSQVTRFIGGAPRPRDLAWAKFCQGAGMWALYGYGFWTVTERDGGFLGVAGLAQFERGIDALAGGHPEAGWAFAPPTWGRGIATEATGAIVAWADATLAVETRCLIEDDNAASIRVAVRNGYVSFADLSGRHVFRRPASFP